MANPQDVSFVRKVRGGKLPPSESIGLERALVFVWIAIGAAVGLLVLALRSMAYAFGASLGPSAADTTWQLYLEPEAEKIESRLGRGEIVMLSLEIAFSLGMSLVIVGLAVTAALPLHLIVGALLAQVAVIGALIAPSVSYNLGQLAVRPAALALGIAQLAHVAFFIQALQALLN